MNSENCSDTEENSDESYIYSDEGLDEMVKRISAKVQNLEKEDIKTAVATIKRLTEVWTEEFDNLLMELMSRDGVGRSQGVMLSVLPSMLLNFNQRVLLLHLKMLDDAGWKDMNGALDNINSAFNTIIKALKKKGKLLFKQMDDSDNADISYIG